MTSEADFDYTTVGHVSVDVLADGSRRPGGGAFYSALQAARLGRRVRVVTQGVVAEIEELLAPYSGEFALEVIPAPATTTLETRGAGVARQQRLLAWAGPISATPVLDTEILHLAPIARETPVEWTGSHTFLGLTPQGLAREWPAVGGPIALSAPHVTAEQLAARCDALVLSVQERAHCERLIERAAQAGAVVVVTAGAGPNTLIDRAGDAVELAVAAIAQVRDDLGAGDVFAAALFDALARGQAVKAAAEFANAAAAVRVGGVGADAIGDLTAIEARLASAPA